MHSDSRTTYASNIPMASSNLKDFGRKKRANRSAKLKQCKLDARREQWLSQVKSKGGKEESSEGTGRQLMHASNGRVRPIEKLEIRRRVEEENYSGSIHQYSDCESPSNSPTSHTSSVSRGNDSRTNFTGSSSGSSSSSSSSSSGGCYSGSMSEDDEEAVDECLDDWEAVADALAATDEKQEERSCSMDPDPENKDVVLDSHLEVKGRPVSRVDMSLSKPENGLSVAVQRTQVNCRAWRPDDDFRPQSLPNLSKQYSFAINSSRHCSCEGSAWGCKSVISPTTSCPICYEDLDFTDSSFLPCPCGFRLCLFCHKRILEDDGRCPGCRKQYNCESIDGETTVDGGRLTFRLARSCSMIARS